VHGWLASLLPLYLRNYYGNDPLFQDSKIVTSVYNQSFEGTLDEEMYDKLQFDALDDSVISSFKEPTYLNLMKSAVVYSDGIIKGSENLESELESFIDSQDKPILDYQSPEDFADAYEQFYLSDILNENEEA
jgi:starch synthase